jgi:HD-like signal output (HDOD) protein
MGKVVVSTLPSGGTSVSTPNLTKEKALRSLGALPPFSPVLNKVLASLASEDVSFTKLADLIEKDTVVSGKLLQLVNSALYARRGTVNSVRHALSLLGINKLRNAVLGMSIARMWNQVRPPAHWSMADFNMHSVACGQLADLLAQKVPVSYPEGAFVAGLLHDVGRLLIAIALPEQSLRIAQRVQQGGCTTADAEREILGFTHAELSADALVVWNLPAPIQEAARDHHLAPGRAVNGEWPLAALVAIADGYVNSAGISISDPDKSANPDSEMLAALGLTEELRKSILTEFQTEYSAMTPFYR